MRRFYIKRRKYIKGSITIVGIIFICIFSLLFIKNILLQNIHDPVFIGVWTEGFWDNKDKDLDIKKIKEFENHIDKKVAVTNYFRGWDELDNADVVKDLNSISDNGWIPMVSTNPYFTNKCTKTTHDIYTTIEKGYCDELIRNIAKVIKSYNKTVFLRFAWEMNIDSNSWSIQSTYSSPQAFIAAWRHIHDLFVEEKVTNVTWVFAVNTETETSIPISSIYPGDTYVDWVGIDGYNWGTTQSWSRWSTFDEVFRKTYLQVTMIAPDKPLMISEFNSVAIGGDKSEWFTDALDTQIPFNYPKIKAIIFFNENKTLAEGVDWRIETSTSVLNSVKKSLKNRIYTSSVNNSLTLNE